MEMTSVVNQQYLRVTKEWTLLASPGEELKYFVNTSGIPVEMQLTATAVKNYNFNTQGFTLGGTIPQITNNSDGYVYARAATDDAAVEAVVIANDNRIDLHAVDLVSELHDQLVTVVMDLTNRIESLESWRAIHKEEYYLFVRKFLDTMNDTQWQIAHHNQHILALYQRLYAAEKLVRNHKKAIRRINEILGSFDYSTLSTQLATFSRGLNSVTAQTTSVIARLEKIEPEIEDLVIDYKSTIEKEITPVQEELASVHTAFASLNNALVKLVATETPETAKAVFDQISAVAEDDMKEPIAAVKDLVVEVMGKVDYEDNVCLTSTADDLKGVSSDTE